MEREKKFQATANTNKLGDILRERENNFHGQFTGRWQGEFHGKPVGTPVVTRYPNLLAEMVVMDYQIDVERLSNAALVSPEVLVAAIEDGEELSAPEMASIVERLNVSKSGRHPVTFGYLASPALSFVWPDTNKGLVQALEFERMYAEAWNLSGLGLRERDMITTVRGFLRDKDSFYSAGYRYAMNALENAISLNAFFEEEKRRRERTRTTRKAVTV